jgi:hypothetical protein
MSASERPWLSRTRGVLRKAAETCPLTLAAVPTNAREERARCLASGSMPRWTYEAPAATERADALLHLRDDLLARRDDALAALFAARAGELALHARMAECVGSRRFAQLAARIAPDTSTTSEIAAAWASTPVATEPAATCATDGEGDTLESALRARLADLHVSWPVIVRPAMAALAATGDGFVTVTAGRMIPRETLERTVVHEVDGHVLPRVCAERSGNPLAWIGTANGVAAQEGWALRCEERAGLFGAARRREIAWRSIAAASMREGADFREVRSQLERDGGFGAEAAYVLAERLFRGSLGVLPGLGREAAYLTYYLRIRDHLEVYPSDEALFRGGVVAPEACALVRAASPPPEDAAFFQ